MPFVPIAVVDYVERFLNRNPGSNAAKVRHRLESALGAFRAGTRCSCGAPIWVIGPAEAGLACFTCITGEAAPVDDYELAEACSRHDV